MDPTPSTHMAPTPTTNYNTGSSITQGSIADVGVTCDPAYVGSAPVHVVFVVVKSELESGGRVQHVPTHSV